MRLVHANVLGESSKHLVVLHGFLGMGDNWKTLGRKWASQGWQVHLLDQRNHGRSFWSSTFDYTSMVEDLRFYCDQNGLDQITLLGHSMGGKVAMLFACTYPSRIKKLIIADIAPKSYPPHHQSILTALSSLNFSQIESREDAENHLSNYIDEAGIRLFLMKNIYRVTPKQLGLRINIEVLKNAGEAIGEALESLRSYTGPTLFLRGEYSNYIHPEEDIPLIRHFFSNAKLVTIPRAGHWLHAENATDFLRALEEGWLS